jgi:subtilisin family serine protease
MSLGKEHFAALNDNVCTGFTQALCDGNGHGTHVSGTIRSQIAGYSL